ncbi:MAG: right-handed parallel beta-helix repeat-containing protein [Deltaproteobacteria bacterium]|nr:right-handed parallel beta-helix repeat-containing protein [Deltaproteobacteria bacterium]
MKRTNAVLKCVGLALLGLWTAMSSVSMAAEVVVPYAATGSGWWTGVAVTNVDLADGQTTEAITVDFYAQNGTLLGSKDIGILAAQAFYVNVVEGIFGGALPERFWMVISHPGRAQISVTVFFGNSAQGGFSTTVYRSDQEQAGIPITHVPFTIYRPGYYYLTGNLESTSTTEPAIDCQGYGVTIDLKGFTLRGPGNSTGANDGIAVKKETVIKNGAIKFFGRYGIVGPSSHASYGFGKIQVVNVSIRNCGDSAISLSGTSNLVQSCRAMENGKGIGSGTGSSVVDSVSSQNQDVGFSIGHGSSARGNVAYLNGSHGFNYYSGSTLTGNSAYKNGETGFSGSGGSGSTLVNNSARNNGNHGFYSPNCLLDQNVATDNNQSEGAYSNISASGSTLGTNHAPE